MFCPTSVIRNPRQNCKQQWTKEPLLARLPVQARNRLVPVQVEHELMAGAPTACSDRLSSAAALGSRLRLRWRGLRQSLRASAAPSTQGMLYLLRGARTEKHDDLIGRKLPPSGRPVSSGRHIMDTAELASMEAELTAQLQEQQEAAAAIAEVLAADVDNEEMHQVWQAAPLVPPPAFASLPLAGVARQRRAIC